MNEIMIIGRSSRKEDAILYVDATRQSLGETTLKDWSENHTFSLVGSGPKVVDVAGLGRAMQFIPAQGQGYFQTQSPVDLSTDPMVIEVVFQSLSPSATQMVWCSGDYATRIVAGLAHYGMVGVGGHQLFTTDRTGNFVRCSINGNQSQVFSLRIETYPDSKQIKVRNLVSGEVQTFSVPNWFGAGERLSVGGSYVGGITYALLQGYVQKLVISKVS